MPPDGGIFGLALVVLLCSELTVAQATQFLAINDVLSLQLWFMLVLAFMPRILLATGQYRLYSIPIPLLYRRTRPLLVPPPKNVPLLRSNPVADPRCLSGLADDDDPATPFVTIECTWIDHIPVNHQNPVSLQSRLIF
uniref:(northern house mosquito) hypothetical protein n=1 Tax=Culex pipiens TaxID=7175 RepID=A0A8D8B005_CULPI